MSTLLTDLDSAAPNKDGDLVDQILREMNSGPSNQGPPAIPPNQGTISDPMPNTAMAHRVMDAAPQTAHVIGGSSPTPADFAAAMHGVPYAPSAPYAQGGQAAAPPPPPRARKSLVKRLTEEFKTPLMVALIVFVFSLPVINFLFAHYLPWSVQPTGQLTFVGLIIKSLGAGGAYWLLQRVVIPLLNM